MTRLRVHYDGDLIRGFSLKGHAGYRGMGKDIVCAAASVLMTTCINALETVAGVLPVVSQREDAARLAATLPEGMTPQQAHDAQIILKTALQGFTDLSKEHSKHFRIIDGRQTSC